MSNYHNIFSYYRGPASSSDVQLEDNTTKALINLLEHGELASSFLQKFVPDALGDATDLRNPEFYLQRGPESPNLSERRFLLGLAPDEFDHQPDGESDERGSKVDGGGSKVDGAISLPGRALVVIEVKTVGSLDTNQLQRHAKRWGVVDEKARTAQTWEDVREWAKHEKDSASGKETAVTRFLLEQFVEHVETHILIRPDVPPGFDDWKTFLDGWGRDLIGRVFELLRPLVPDVGPVTRAQHDGGRDHRRDNIAGYFGVIDPDNNGQKLWLLITPEGGGSQRAGLASRAPDNEPVR